MTRSSYRSSLVKPTAMKEVENIDVAMQAYGIKLTRDLANERFKLLNLI